MAQMMERIGEVQRATEAGDLVSACRTFYSEVALANDDEVEVLEEVGALTRAATSMPLLLRMAAAGPMVLSDPEIPTRIEAPTLVIRGSDTDPFYGTKAADTANRIPDARLSEIDGAGHLGPQVLPETVAEELRSFRSRC